MKISIITVSYNAADTIEDCIQSIARQTYHEIEHVIIDGGSTDGTVSIVEKHRDRISVFITEPDKGIYDAMNKGICLATGDVIGILNADDKYMHDNVISKIMVEMTSGNVDAIYGDLVYVNRQNTDRITRRWIAGQYYHGAFARGWLPPHPTFFCKKILYEEYGVYNINFEIAADYELMLRYIVKHNIRLGYLREVLVKMRNGGRANVIRGMIKGGWETLYSFRINKLPIPWRLLVYRPITIMKQVLAAKDCGVSL